MPSAFDAVDRLEQLLGGIDAVASPSRARSRLRPGSWRPTRGARRHSCGETRRRAGGRRPRARARPDGVSGGRHAGPAPFLNGMPVWNSVARTRSPSWGRRSESGTILTPSCVARAGRAVDLHQMPIRVAQEQLHRAVGQPVGLSAVGARRRTRRAPRRAGKPSAKSSTATAKWCSGGDRRVALEEVQLTVAETQPDRREADIRDGQLLAAEEPLVEARRAREIRRRERDVI